MKVRCVVQKLVFEPTWCGGTFREWGDDEPKHLATHFRLDLHTLQSEVSDSGRIEWVKKELIKSTKEFPLTLDGNERKDKSVYVQFNGYFWKYSIAKAEIYMRNADIDI